MTNTTAAGQRTEPTREQLIAAVRKMHAAKGRYHSQLATCELFDLLGLACIRPGQGQLRDEGVARDPVTRPITDDAIQAAAEAQDNDSAWLAGFYSGARWAESEHGIVDASPDATVATASGVVDDVEDDPVPSLISVRDDLRHHLVEIDSQMRSTTAPDTDNEAYNHAVRSLGMDFVRARVALAMEESAPFESDPAVATMRDAVSSIGTLIDSIQDVPISLAEAYDSFYQNLVTEAMEGECVCAVPDGGAASS